MSNKDRIIVKEPSTLAKTMQTGVNHTLARISKTKKKIKNKLAPFRAAAANILQPPR